MTFKKFKADKIFDGFTLLPGTNVLITDEHGTVKEILPENEAGSDVQELNGILTPGFINCHCHLELSHMKGLIAEKTGLIDFVFNVVTQRHFGEEEILGAIAMAENEMLQNGIIAVGDICNNNFTLSQKQKANLHYFNFIEASGWLPEIAETRFKRSEAFFNEFSKIIPTTSIVPHAPYSVSNDLWNLISAYFKDSVVSIHNQETNFEDELFLQGTGDFIRMYEMMKIDNSFYKASKKSSLQTYFTKLEKAASIILVHNTFTSKADIDYALHAAGTHQQLLSFCLCPNANLYIEDQLPPVELLANSNCNIVLGTDSLASNYSLSILDEIKTIHKNFTSISIEQLLKWATINGAKALQMDNKLGSFEKGKQPGLVLIEEIADGNFIEQTTAKRIL